MIHLFPRIERYIIEQKRQHFFSVLLDELAKPPCAIDDKLGQNQHWVRPDIESASIAFSTLSLSVYPTFHGKNLHFWYSFWQVGQELRAGVILEGETQTAPMVEGKDEISHLFPDVQTERHDRDGRVMYQWTLKQPGFFDEWIHRENVIFNIRHLHFRMCRIIHDGTKE